jgi:hypothetical protein
MKKLNNTPYVIAALLLIVGLSFVFATIDLAWFEFPIQITIGSESHGSVRETTDYHLGVWDNPEHCPMKPVFVEIDGVEKQYFEAKASIYHREEGYSHPCTFFVTEGNELNEKGVLEICLLNEMKIQDYKLILPVRYLPAYMPDCESDQDKQSEPKEEGSASGCVYLGEARKYLVNPPSYRDCLIYEREVGEKTLPDWVKEGVSQDYDCKEFDWSK